MKKLLCLVIGLGLLPATPAFAQDPTPPPPREAAPAASLTRFDLDFPGGTPAELVATIQVVRTAAAGSRFHVIGDAELLALANPRPAILVRRGPHSAELIFTQPDEGENSPLN